MVPEAAQDSVSTSQRCLTMITMALRPLRCHPVRARTLDVHRFIAEDLRRMVPGTARAPRASRYTGQQGSTGLVDHCRAAVPVGRVLAGRIGSPTRSRGGSRRAQALESGRSQGRHWVNNPLAVALARSVPRVSRGPCTRLDEQEPVGASRKSVTAAV